MLSGVLLHLEPKVREACRHVEEVDLEELGVVAVEAQLGFEGFEANDAAAISLCHDVLHLKLFLLDTPMFNNLTVRHCPLEECSLWKEF